MEIQLLTLNGTAVSRLPVSWMILLRIKTLLKMITEEKYKRSW